MGNQYSAAIVGCGMIAGQFQDRADEHTYSHAKALFQHPQFTNVGYFDINSESSRSLSKMFPGTSFRSLDEVLVKVQPDLVSLCSPDDCHYEQIIELLEHRYCPRIIFVEKPVCTNELELVDIVSRLRSNGVVKLCVNHSRRFDNSHLQIAKDINAGEFGQFHFCNINYYGGWQHNGIHVVDFLHACFSDDVIAENISFACSSNYIDDPTLNLSGRIAGGDIVFKGHDEKFYQVTEIDLFFSEGRVVISDFGMKIEAFKRIINGENERVLQSIYSPKDSMKNQIENAYSRIARYLDSAEFSDLSEVSVETAARVMRNIWSVKKIYDQQKD